MDLLQRLAVRNGFEFHRDRTQKVETIKMTYYEEVPQTLYKKNHSRALLSSLSIAKFCRLKPIHS